MNRILFLSNDSLVGAGHDFNPLLFSADASGFWCVPLLQSLVLLPPRSHQVMATPFCRSFVEFVDKKPTDSAAVKRNSGSFSAGR